MKNLNLSSCEMQIFSLLFLQEFDDITNLLGLGT
ncbi:hypothetical protein M2142_002496, partial [Fusobacterium sp. PH5-29]